MRATSKDYPGSVLSVDYNFIVDVQHCVISDLTINDIPDVIYEISDPRYYWNFNAATWTTMPCPYPATITYTAKFYDINGNQVPKPSYVNFNPSPNREFNIYTTDRNNRGDNYKVILTASLPQPGNPANTATGSTSFFINVPGNCDGGRNPTKLIDKTIPNMTVYVGVPQTADVYFQNDKSVSRSDPPYCGPTAITFIPTQPLFISLDSTALGP